MSENLTTARQLIDPIHLVPLFFSQDNVAASQTNVQLTALQVASAAENVVDSYRAPWAGTIVGISAVLSAAATAGTLTVGATIAGTEGADPTLSITTAASASDTAARGNHTFAAGDLIGCEITTDGSWDATTSDLLVQVYVMYEVTGV